jgi:2'-5' RNA ligase
VSDSGPQEALETGLVIPVPEIQDVVQEWRSRAEVAPPVGTPSHVTLLYPFVPPDEADDQLAELERFFGVETVFDFSLTEVGWFGREVVYLRPEPIELFRSLTERVSRHWPDYPPYGGAHADPLPHVTIADNGDPAAMADIAREAAEILPIACRADAVWLMVGHPRPPSWSVKARFALSPFTPPDSDR